MFCNIRLIKVIGLNMASVLKLRCTRSICHLSLLSFGVLYYLHNLLFQLLFLLLRIMFSKHQ